MITTTRLATVFTAGLCWTLAAGVQANGENAEGKFWEKKTEPKAFYIGTGFGPGSFDLGNTARTIDGVDFQLAGTEDDDISSRFFLGYWITDHFGVEFGSADYGTINQPFTYSDSRNGDSGPGEADVNVDGTSFAFVGSYDVGDLYFFGQVGMMQWTQEIDVRFDHPGEDAFYHINQIENDGTSLVLGGGVAWNFAPGVWLRGEAEFTEMDDDSLSSYRASILYDFGALVQHYRDSQGSY